MLNEVKHLGDECDCRVFPCLAELLCLRLRMTSLVKNLAP